jgi:phage recombination protein Bet
MSGKNNKKNTYTHKQTKEKKMKDDNRNLPVPAPAHNIDYANREVIDTIKRTVAKGASDAELAQFLEVCKATGLNPFLREVWYVGATKTIMAARDGYLRIANEHPQFDGIESYTIDDPSGDPLKGVCIVYRKDRNHPIKMEAKFKEYNKPKSNVWQQYPSAMIIKVAEVLALKRSFSINGVVTPEEMQTEEPANTILPEARRAPTKMVTSSTKPKVKRKGPDEFHSTAGS